MAIADAGQTILFPSAARLMQSGGDIG